MQLKMKTHIVNVCAIALLSGVFLPVHAQENPIQPGERDVAQAMLKDVQDDLLANYYDPKYRDLDVKARFKEADDRIKKATSLNQALGTIAWALEGLHDSHTSFIPPPRPFRLYYGWTMQMIGTQCYVTDVEPGSDAEKKGVKPGDLIEQINRIVPTRETLWSLNYLLRILRPQPGFELVVRSVSGEERTVGVAAKIEPSRRVVDIMSPVFWNEIRDSQSALAVMQRRPAVLGHDLIVLKFPTFLLEEKGVDAMIGESRKYKVMVLDLRGNHGGSILALLRMLSGLFEGDTAVGEMRMRKKTEPQTAKSRGDKIFAGKLIVLVDAESASAAEVLAREVQLQKRGLIIGDKTAGKVMEARAYPHHVGLDRIVYYASYISVADWIMPDGKSLEDSGVTPDELMLPDGSDLANRRDPVLSHAISLGGAQISAEDAYKLFPHEWPAH
ncbi:MAG: S41 family peptidase [Candidatus Acidiferrales bacterium]